MSVVSKCAAVALGLLVSWSAAAAEPRPAPPPPTELTSQAVDSADFDGWRARSDARAKADAERKTAVEAVAKARKKKDKAAARDRLAKLPKPDDGADPFLVRAQVLLDRVHASPGVIDGRDGDNFKKAVRAFREMRGMPIEGGLDPEVWTALAADKAPALKPYVIYSEDVNGRYEDKLPADYAKLAKLKWLGYRDAVEMLSERFHMDPPLLRALNPGVDFKTAGVAIQVADVGGFAEGTVRRVTVDKKLGELRAYDDADKIVMIAPATIGSPDTPSPEGKMTINGAFPDPHYIYDPKKNFQQGKNRSKLTLPPGPNGPVGSMWIDLSKPTYGIHGTPEPSQISKTASHGCVRLTNWDAAELARMIKPKVTEVEFSE
ncbi:L,D-transpeptidase [Methylopila sp. 73B]|uniref:L,D-transpeptidase family protein n=1 Tax=Methylopila sp. 73B TaxID=1120792 RepID=UPI00037D72F1|nr:L,D-transpeptidase [Methylopila sp. 73B]